ncbi:RNA 3'-terminal phosphate cyclase [Nitrososphaera sp. AFS]|uniref:RNA 3'-terminal phosphate cyclase n=1 Tax=Nitrososphaera sp. AFS TaxID=2301191 RepID=UPI001392284F|nr:RNA 3'-terminal phosphate cyclase [Nitrososphaera sp. AFS]NAL77312.1 RNA 3'-terminal phosphate cyclase [Nitrososphaera sp. AFS]
MLTIDGSYGEGGGQILRSAISLSAITGKALEVINIRANRQRPGLRPQHMHATRALSEIFKARVDNLKVGAEWIRFTPVRDHYEGGELKIDTGTAGSIPMILLTIIPAVALSRKGLSVQIIGGTDVKMSPTMDYLRFIVSKAYRNLGINFTLEVYRRGYYPKGGGIVRAEIKPCNNLNTLDLLNHRYIEPKIASVCCQLPKHVAERQVSSALLRLEKKGVHCREYSSSLEASLSAGSSIIVYSESDFGPYLGGDSIGAKNVPAEQVGVEAANGFSENYDAKVPIDRFLADMLVIPLSLANGRSRYRIAVATEHLRTNLHVVSQIVGCTYRIMPENKSYVVLVEGHHRRDNEPH